MELDFHKNPEIFTSMLNSIADGVFTVNAKGEIVAWSAGAARITGYAQEEVVGRSCHFLEGQTCKGFSKLQEFLDNPSPAPWAICNQECKVLARDGRELYLYGSVSVIRDEQRNVIGAIGTFTDLTAFNENNQKIEVLEEQTKSREAFDQLVGKSPLMEAIFRQLRLAGQSDVSVLLTGESGTGKELAARAIHASSARKDKPFLGVNCSAIPETLLESELFGHVKGAFTGATRDKVGLFQAANGGTLFIDEVGDMSPMLQLKLLRVLQEREIRRVGDERGMHVDVRILTATHRDLKTLIASGAIREDFYYRIRVFEIRLPALRERRIDIPLLVNHFISDCSKTYNKTVKGLTREAMKWLMEYPWPGNVRELKHAIEHAFVIVGGDHLTLLDLPPEIRHPNTQGLTNNSSAGLTKEEESELTEIATALQQSGGNRTKAAHQLGYSRVTLWKKMRRFGIDSEALR